MGALAISIEAARHMGLTLGEWWGLPAWERELYGEHYLNLVSGAYGTQE